MSSKKRPGTNICIHVKKCPALRELSLHLLRPSRVLTSQQGHQLIL